METSNKNQSRQNCKLLLAFLLWTRAVSEVTDGPDKFLHFNHDILDPNFVGLVFHFLLAGFLLVLTAVILGKVTTVVKC